MNFRKTVKFAQKLLFPIMSAFIVTGCPVQLDCMESSGSIEGSVILTNAVSEKSSGIMVSVYRQGFQSFLKTSITDQEGNFSFTGIVPGIYCIKAENSCSVEKVIIESINVVSGQKTLCNFGFTGTGSLRGRILIDGNECGNGGFVISLRECGLLCVTDDEGFFEITDIPASEGITASIMRDTVFAGTFEAVIAAGSDNNAGDILLSSIELARKDRSFIWKGSYSSHDEISSPCTNWAYYNTQDGCSYIFDGNGWCLLASKGEAGTDGKDGIDGKDGADGKDGRNGIDGKDGIDGINGENGKDGVDGRDGRDGLNGKDGKDGKDGTDGKDGRDGLNGKDGKDGSDGLNGRDGLNGTDGKDGTDGTNGRDGRDGIDGRDGLNGKDGTDGKDGRDGLNGKDGTDGKDGADGKDGTDGINGRDGKDGIDGKNGRDGLNGKDGTDGKDGKDGTDGINGRDGKDGIDGKDGLNGKDGKDGRDGLNGLNGKDGTDGRDGRDGFDGTDGTDGKDGSSFVWMGTFTSHPSNPDLYSVYYNIAENTVYIWNGYSWEIMFQTTASSARPSPVTGADIWDTFPLLTWNDPVCSNLKSIAVICYETSGIVPEYSAYEDLPSSTVFVSAGTEEYLFTGLDSRNYYTFCLYAVDTSNNISEMTSCWY